MLAYDAAENTLGSGPMRQIDKRRVPSGTAAAAMAGSWDRCTETLRQSIRNAHDVSLEEVMPPLAPAIGVAESLATAFDLFRQKVSQLLTASSPIVSPLRFNAGNVWGRRGSREDEDEEEAAPRNLRHRSVSWKGDFGCHQLYSASVSSSLY